MFIPLICQSLNVMFYIYSHHDSWKSCEKKQLYNCFKYEVEIIKAVRNHRTVLIIVSPEAELQNYVLIIYNK